MDGTQLAAVSREGDVIVWSYSSGKMEILFQKKLDKHMSRIDWNTFRPNEFAITVSCFFSFHVPHISPFYSFLQNIRPKSAKSNLMKCLEPQHFIILSSS
jgi:hypothetical protein